VFWKKKAPTAAIIDSQSVKTANHPGVRGYDAGKKVLGRKRHILVDTLGLVILAKVHPANIQDRDGAKLLLEPLQQKFGWVKKIWADSGYSGKLKGWVSDLKRHRKVDLEIVKRNEVKCFKVLPKRWIVERTFAWISANRRMTKDYETLPENSEAMLKIAMFRIMLNRIH